MLVAEPKSPPKDCQFTIDGGILLARVLAKFDVLVQDLSAERGGSYISKVWVQQILDTLRDLQQICAIVASIVFDYEFQECRDLDAFSTRLSSYRNLSEFALQGLDSLGIILCARRFPFLTPTIPI